MTVPGMFEGLFFSFFVGRIVSILCKLLFAGKWSKQGGSPFGISLRQEFDILLAVLLPLLPRTFDGGPGYFPMVIFFSSLQVNRTLFHGLRSAA